MDNEGKTVTSANDDIKAEDTKSRKPFIKRVAEAVKKFVPAAVYSRLRLRSGRNNE